jgi:hypothetical protein
MVISSLAFWALVAAMAIGFAPVVRVVTGGREEARFYRLQVAAYVLAWGLLIGVLFGTTLLKGLPTGPPWPVWDFPSALLIGAPAAFIGAHLVATLFGARRDLLHPTRRRAKRPSRKPTPQLTDAELAAAEAYDAQWRAKDRERNRRLRPPRGA